MQQEHFWGAGAWPLFQALHQDSLKRLPSGPIRHVSKLFDLIGPREQADVGAAAGGSDGSSTSFSHRRTISQHQQLSHTTPPDQGPLQPVTSMHTHTHTLECLSKTETHSDEMQHIYIYNKRKDFLTRLKEMEKFR